MTPMTESRQPIIKAIFLISFSSLRSMLPSITRRPQRIRACMGEKAKKTRKAIKAMSTDAYLTISDIGLIFRSRRSSRSTKDFHQKKNRHLYKMAEEN